MGFVRPRLGWLALGLVLIVGGVWKLAPVLANHFYRADGYAFLHQALELLGDEISEPDFCVAGGVTDSKAFGLVEQAVEALEKGREARPSDAQTLLLLGRAYCLAGRLEEAVAAYEGFSALRPGNPLGALEVGFAYEEEEDFEQAAQQWHSMELSQAQFIEAGKVMAEEENFKQAITWLKKAVLYFPHTADASFELGVVYSKNREWALSLEAFDAALAQGVFQNTAVGNVYYQKGLIYQTVPEFTDLPEAFEMYSAGLETGAFSSVSTYANVYYKRGEIYLWMDDLESAVGDFREAIALSPGHYLAHLRLGSTLFQISGDVAQAEDEILQAIALWPNLSQKEWPYRVLGEVYASAGWTDKAIAALHEALRINPNDSKAQLSLENLQTQKSP
ncbi:MAG TPA: tetratricopeptide repeat protein [Anaerolineales bacterium]|nr:tetratricopeptide repeat protein [Anaerolineales bacterium]